MKRMKKCTLWLVILALLLPLAACADETESTLYLRGLDVAHLLADMAQTKGYAPLFANDSSMTDLVRAVGRGDYTTPAAAYRLTLPGGADALLSALGADAAAALPQSLREYITQRLSVSLAAMLNSPLGTVAVATSSILTAETLFVDQGAKDTLAYLYAFTSGYPVLVAFRYGEDGAVAATGSFLLDASLTPDTLPSALNDKLAAFGFAIEPVR